MSEENGQSNPPCEQGDCFGIDTEVTQLKYVGTAFPGGPYVQRCNNSCK